MTETLNNSELKLKILLHSVLLAPYKAFRNVDVKRTKLPITGVVVPGEKLPGFIPYASILDDPSPQKPF
jgi:hypothetical protein